MTQPSLSVVIPSRHRLERLPALIATYLDQRADQVVIVLDGPHPGWRDVLGSVVEDERVDLVELDPNRGLALARTCGLELATRDIVLIADDDVAPHPGLVERHRAFHAAHDRSVLLGYMPVLLPERRGRDQAATFVYARDYENQVRSWESDPTPAHLLESFWGGTCSVPRELYLEAEAYLPSTRLMYNEDLDLGLRLKQVGVGASFDRTARADHRHQRSFAAFRAECLVRGEAVADLELRWTELPGQLRDLVRIPEGRGAARRLQAAIGRRDTPGAAERALVALHDLAGLAHAWSVQDAVARFLRRALAIRGYRLAVAAR